MSAKSIKTNNIGGVRRKRTVSASGNRTPLDRLINCIDRDCVGCTTRQIRACLEVGRKFLDDLATLQRIERME